MKVSGDIVANGSHSSSNFSKGNVGTGLQDLGVVTIVLTLIYGFWITRWENRGT